MKVTYLRATAALALGLALAGCGGKAMFDVGGLIFTGTTPGVTNGGMVLRNGNDTITIPAGATSFIFPTRISYGTDYNMEILSSAAHMDCKLFNGSGSAGHTATIQASIQCTQNSYALSGTVTGLAGADTVGTGLVLVNGSTGGQVGVEKPADGSGRTTFSFAAPVLDGDAYGVTVNVQPIGLNCTVTNGTGIMHETPISNVQVTCAPR